jgi:Lamin Tail Domain
MKILFTLFPFLSIISVQLHAQSCDPFFGKLVINEFMAKNVNAVADQDGEFNDWVEIYNGSMASINLQGYFLTDNASNETKWAFPDISIAANGYLIVWTDGDSLQSGVHTNFKLSADGEELTLYSPDTISLDFIKYGTQVSNATIGRFPNGTGPFVAMEDSYGATNLNSIFVKLVINEYMASNSLTVADENGSFGDWVELYNNSNFSVNLNGYYLSNSIKNPEKWKFPSVAIAAQSYLTIWCDGDSLEGPLHTNFNLSAENDDLVLSTNDTITIDYVRFQNQVTDFSEGRFPNGNGPIECLIPTYSQTNSLNTTSVSETENMLKPNIVNPVNENLTINFKQPYSGIVSLSDVLGKLIFSKTYTNTLLINENISLLNGGIYFISGSNIYSKILIER